MHSFLSHYFLVWKSFGYLIAFLGMIFEGDGFLFAVSFFTHQGFFNLPLMFLIVFCGAVFGDFLWYWFGYHFHNSENPRPLFVFARHWISHFAKPIDRQLKGRPNRAILISKFAYGFHHVVLMRAGALEMEMKNFMKIDIIATLIWILVIGGLGYLTGFSLILFKRYLRFAEFLIIGVVMIFFAVWHFIVARKLKKEL